MASPQVSPPVAATPAPEIVVPPDIRVLIADRPHRPREILVVIATQGAPETVTSLLREYNLVAGETTPIALLDAVVARLLLVDNRPLDTVLARLARDPRILQLQPNYIFETNEDAKTSENPALRTVTAEKPVLPSPTLPQYAPDKIHLNAAHAITRGREVRIAIVDTAIDEGHPELGGAVTARFDALGEGPVEAEAHGTAIAGIVAARRDLKGVAPEAMVLSVRAFRGVAGRTPQSATLAIVKGVDWAFANGARLFNLSFAGPLDPLLGKVLAAAESRGAIFIAAAGNGGPEARPAYPAAFPEVIAVTATDAADRVFADANRGAYITVGAPGVDILAPAPEGRYALSSGTSLAAAHVTGVVALLLAQNPRLTTADIRAILKRTARKPDHTPASQTSDLGAGVLDAGQAVGDSRAAHK